MGLQRVQHDLVTEQQRQSHLGNKSHRPVVSCCLSLKPRKLSPPCQAQLRPGPQQTAPGFRTLQRFPKSRGPWSWAPTCLTDPLSSCVSNLIFSLPPRKPEKDGKGEAARFPKTNNPNRAFSAVTLSLLCQPQAEGGRK